MILRVLRWRIRMLWWRARVALWYAPWRLEFAVGKWRVFHGIHVRLEPVLNEELETVAFGRVSAALDLIAQYEPRRLTRIVRDLPRIWIRRTAYSSGYYFSELKACVLDRKFVTGDDTTATSIAVLVVHEATHVRLDKCKIPYAESVRPRIEAICDAESAAFARRLPGGESLACWIMETRPTDPMHWSSRNLAHRWSEAKRVELADFRQELEKSDIPDWLKRMLAKVFPSRAA